MAQLSITRFNRIGFFFSIRNCILSKVIPKSLIGFIGITVIPFGFGRFIYHCLYGLLGATPNDLPTQKAACFSVNKCQEVDFVFFSPIKVNNSSISAVLTLSGMGGSGKPAAYALTHKDTVL